MKNAIKYYYNFDVTLIHRNNDEYEIYNGNKRYRLIKYEKLSIEADEKYSLQLYLQSINVYCHKIIKNVMKKIITIINEKNYIMIQMVMPNRVIKLEDIIHMSNIWLIENLKYNKKNSWQKLWKIKIDYLEYEIQRLNKKYPSIKESFDYYSGIVETCISILENSNIKNINKSITHERITKNTNTDYFYNPLNLVIDNRTRDIGEYLKSEIYNYEYDILKIEEYIEDNMLTAEEKILLLTRILYPSKYLDACEQVMSKRMTEKELLKIINSSHIQEANLKKIYTLIKKLIQIPEVEWLERN